MKIGTYPELRRNRLAKGLLLSAFALSACSGGDQVEAVKSSPSSVSPATDTIPSKPKIEDNAPYPTLQSVPTTTSPNPATEKAGQPCGSFPGLEVKEAAGRYTATLKKGTVCSVVLKSMIEGQTETTIQPEEPVAIVCVEQQQGSPDAAIRFMHDGQTFKAVVAPIESARVVMSTEPPVPICPT